ncbi:E3 ubiquitin-protein ligase TRIM71-like [Saccostrea cucullata]|uniref:E3 ubiquitin-protein ligase TRIM71-like n=1 Tax=Saccostrea cuccullata TaxID=36930 RepID=UPI002ED65AD7
MFCKQCAVPVCTKCLSTDRHLGHKLSEILQILNETKDNIIKEHAELKETIYPTYLNIESDVQNIMMKIEREYADLSVDISQHKKFWHNKIDKIFDKLETEVDKTKKTQLQTLQKHLDEIKQDVSEISKEINLLEVAFDTQDISVLYKVKFNAEGYRKLPQRILPSVPKFTPEKFQENEVLKLLGALSSSSLTSDAHGYSMKTMQKSPVQTGLSPSVKHFLDEPVTILIRYIMEYQLLYKVVTITVSTS